MAVDLSVFGNQKSLLDQVNLQREFELKKALAAQQIQTGAIDAATKQNAYATQVLSGAAAGGQPSYDLARQKLAGMGIDVSAFDPDVNKGNAQLQAARLAQSPIGSLLGLGLKAEGQVNAAAGTFGSQQAGAAASPIGSAISAAVGMNPMIGKLIQAESGGNPNAVSPAGAQGIAQIMPSTAANPGYGVKPLQGWDGKNPSTAPVGEQIRFGNDYLNAMQAQNGGNPQLAAAAYNAGPGAVANAVAQNPQNPISALPAETQSYVPKLTGLPPQQQGETQAAYNQRIQNILDVQKADPKYQAAIKFAESQGGKEGENIAEVKKAYDAALSQFPNVYGNFQAMREAAPNASYGVGGFLMRPIHNTADDATAASNTVLDQKGAQNTLKEIGPILSTAGVKGNKFLETLASQATAVDNATGPKAKVIAVNGLDDTYTKGIKGMAAELRAAGIPTLSDEDIDNMAKANRVAPDLTKAPDTPSYTMAEQADLIKNAKKARDGKFYSPDPKKPGSFIEVRL